MRVPFPAARTTAQGSFIPTDPLLKLKKQALFLSPMPLIVYSHSQTNKPGEFIWISNRIIGDNPCSFRTVRKEATVTADQPQTDYLKRIQRLCSLGFDLLTYVLVRILVSFIQTLPADMGDKLCHRLAWITTVLLKIRHDITEQNLKQVFPNATEADRRRLAYAMWHHLLLMVCEIAWAQRRLHLTNWTKHIVFHENRRTLRHLLSRRPKVTATGHFGNFEIGGYLTGLMGFNTLTIARKLDNRFVHHWVERFRGAKGQHMVDKDGCGPMVDAHLKRGGTLTLLADQHAGPKGCWVSFLGVPASCHKALALFSLSAGATMMIGSTTRIQGRPMQFKMACTGIADPDDDPEGNCESITTLTHWYNDQLSAAINESVEQYWWLHRRWRTPPPRVAARLAKAEQVKAA